MQHFEPLTNVAGEPFSDDALDAARHGLERLSNEERVAYRNANAAAIASDPGGRLLVVAGPGTGKSTLFMQRIETWLGTHGKKSIYVSSFVRKLVLDLRSEVQARELAGQVTVETLHHLARSLVERNGGSQSLRLGRFIKMIGPEWKAMVWEDVLSLADIGNGPTLREFESQLFANELSREEPWLVIRAAYFRLCQFYNAIGFADSILLATEAVYETPELVEHTLWIVDEFQDFNASEEALIRACVRTADAVLLAGDDDQALYQALKASHPEIIRGYYADTGWGNAMLPFCSRCDYHVAMAATAFLEKTRERDSIRKVFLPLQVEEEAEPVRIVMCSGPTVAVDYIAAFIEAHRAEIEARRDAILEGSEKDPFLLILSPQRDVERFYGKEAERLDALVSEWRMEVGGPGPDYLRAMLYYGVARRPDDNFALRKILELEGIPPDTAHAIIGRALEDARPLSQVGVAEIQQCLETCRDVALILDGDESTDDQAGALEALIRVEDAERFSMDLTNFPVGGGESDEEELIETAGAISPVELLTMVGAKGLSTDHVIIIGCDDVNMGNASPQVFFVAMTRARRSLHLLPALKARGASRPHDYLSELPSAHVSYAKATMQGMEVFDSRKAFERYLGCLVKARKKYSGAKKASPKARRRRG